MTALVENRTAPIAANRYPTSHESRRSGAFDAGGAAGELVIPVADMSANRDHFDTAPQHDAPDMTVISWDNGVCNASDRKC
jgi:hypothetical protein